MCNIFNFQFMFLKLHFQLRFGRTQIAQEFTPNEDLCKRNLCNMSVLNKIF